MAKFPTHQGQPDDERQPAPDGMAVEPMLATAAGSMARFLLEAGRVGRAVRHVEVAEIWYVQAGAGQMWRASETAEELTDLRPGTCVVIEPGIRFQVRSTGQSRLEVVGVTMPPWPGDAEAEVVDGRWPPSLA